MKVSRIIPVVLISLGIIGGVLYAAGINLPWGPSESTSSGYLTPISGGSKEVLFNSGSCVKVISSTATRYFIPTRTAAEIASFTGHLPSGITTSSCTTPFCYVYYAKNFGYDYVDFELGIGDSVGPFAIEGTKFYTTCTAYGGALCQETDPRSDYNSYLCTIPTNGSCGSANGTTTASYPLSNHCSAGTKVDVDTTGVGGTFDWRCDGIGGGSDTSCSANKIVYTYSWQSGAWGSCSVSCGGGTQTRTVVCRRNDGTTVADTFCSGIKPPTSQACNTQACGAPQNGLCGSICNGYTDSPGCDIGNISGLTANDTTKRYYWTCSGVNGGSPTACLALALPSGYNDGATCVNMNHCDFGYEYEFNPTTGRGVRIHKTSCRTPERRTNQYSWNSITDIWEFDSYIGTTGGSDDRGYCTNNC